ncbi:MAG TPA: hypothetical protein VF516_16505 [Kofleriaceae bacterium]
MHIVASSHWGRRVIVSVLCVAAAILPLAAEADPRSPWPRELLGWAALGPPKTIRDLRAYADAIQPGLGTALSEVALRAALARAAGMRSLDGFDSAHWPYVLAAGVDGARPIALVGRVTDARQLAASAGSACIIARSGWAVVGDERVVTRIADYALAAIATKPQPRVATAEIYLSRVLDHYRSELEIARNLWLTLATMSSGGRGAAPAGLIEALDSLASTTDRLVAMLQVTPEFSTLELRLTPKSGSWLAKLVTLQRRTSYRILERLPAGPAVMRIGGHLEAGPFRDELIRLIPAHVKPRADRSGPMIIQQAASELTGDFAVAIDVSATAPVTFTYLAGLTSTAAGERTLATYIAATQGGYSLQTFNGVFWAKPSPKLTIYHGVTLHSIDLVSQPSTVSPAGPSPLPVDRLDGRVEYAAFDGLGMELKADDSEREAIRTIDAARGKAPHFVLPPLLQASSGRGDSLVLILDIARMIEAVWGHAAAGAPPLVVTAGRADQDARITIAIPAVVLRMAASLGGP